MGVMKRLATGAGGPRIRTGRYGKSFDGFHVDFSMFVDRKGVMERVERKRLAVLSKTGAYSMGAMRKMIRNPSTSKKSRTVQVGDKLCFVPMRGKVFDTATGQPVSTPLAARAVIAMRDRLKSEGVGQPPRRGVTDLLRKRIFFGVDVDGDETVVIGPEMFAAQPTLVGAVSVPQLLDQGGKEVVHVGGLSFLATYEPRPFTAPTMPIAQQKMNELIELLPL